MLGVEKITDEHGRVLIQDPPIARFLFQSTAAAWLWLVVRIWLGWAWLEAGWHKLTDPAWMDGSGSAILAFWTRAVAVPEPPARPLIAYDWYRAFLQYLIDIHAEGWFSKLIVFAELGVGIALIAGAFVGIAAAAGLTMNMAFMLAGTASTNPLLAMAAMLLILAWKNAGYVGLDRYLLPLLGTPWPQERMQRPRQQLLMSRRSG